MRVSAAPHRIVMVSGEYVPYVQGGAETQAHRLAGWLAGRGHHVTVLTSRTGATAPQQEMRDGVRIVRLWAPGAPRSGLRHVPAAMVWRRAVLRWLRRERDRIDIIHAHQAKVPAYIAAVAARRLRKPMLVKVGTAEPNLDFRILARVPLVGRHMARYLSAAADCVVCISSAMAAEARAFGVPAGRVRFIPNGIDVPDAGVLSASSRLEARRRLGIDPGARCFLFVGRLVEQKNPMMLLESFARAAPDGDSQLLLLGDGPLRGALEARVAELGMQGSVAFAGHVDNVPDYLMAADVFVLPSRAEGLSNALLEAMSYGRACVSTRVSGSTDLIEHGVNGLLVDTADAAGLQSALAQLAAAGAERLRELGAAARRTIEGGYSLDATGAAYESLYTQLITMRAA